MDTKYLLAIDIGTSGCKISLFDLAGCIISTYLGEYQTYYFSENCVEQDAGDWWEQVCRGINEIKNSYDINTDDILAIGVDGHSWACLPVDRDGLPLRRAMIWLDRRAEKQTAYLKNYIGEERLINTNGNPVDSAYITPKMLWLRDNEADIYKRTYKFLQSNAYIVYKLSGEYSQDLSQGYGFHFFDIHKGEWAEEIANELDISLDLMAPLYSPHEVVGRVNRSAAVETGLKEGIPVIAGGLDAACCTLGAGVIKPGQTQEQGGQAGGMSIVLDKAVIHSKLILGNHVVPDKWLLQGGTVGGGGVLNWFNRELGFYEHKLAEEQGKNPYQVMSQEAASVPAGSEGLMFLPYMAGERSPLWDTKARGVFFGLSYDKGRKHLIRSMMEGVAYSLRHNLETAEEVGAVAEELNSVGGSANSEVWTQLKSDISNKTIRVPYADQATSLGAAILAGVGVGVYSNFEDAVETTIKIARVHKPDQAKLNIYHDYYQLYIDLYQKLKDSYQVLYNISEN